MLTPTLKSPIVHDLYSSDSIPFTPQFHLSQKILASELWAYREVKIGPPPPDSEAIPFFVHDVISFSGVSPSREVGRENYFRAFKSEVLSDFDLLVLPKIYYDFIGVLYFSSCN
jgi:hypothetical protein